MTADDTRPRIVCPNCKAQLIPKNLAAERFTCPQCTTNAPMPPLLPPSSAGRFTKRAVVGIATLAFMLGGMGGCMVGCSFGSYSASHPDSSSMSDAEKATALRTEINGIPLGSTDARLLAIATCMAFKQHPGVSRSDATRQLATQQNWTQDQSATVLDAITDLYCPEYRNGS